VASPIAYSAGITTPGDVCDSQVCDVSGSRQLGSVVHLGSGHFRICHNFCLTQSQEALLTYPMCTENILYAVSESFWTSPMHCPICIAFTLRFLPPRHPLSAYKVDPVCYGSSGPCMVQQHAVDAVSPLFLGFIRTVALFSLAGRVYISDLVLSYSSLKQPEVSSICYLCTCEQCN